MEITPSLIVSIFAAGISVVSLYWSFKSWKETYRPLITARVTTHTAGNEAIALDLVVSNTGNRPAKNVILTAHRSELEKVFAAGPQDPLRQDVEHCFSDPIVIIPNGSSVSNSFGCFSASEKDRTWKEPTIIYIHIKYEDLNGRRYSHHQPLRIRADEGFAGGAWG